MPLTPLNPGQVKAIPLKQLVPDPDQIRKTFQPASLRELADSLKAHGQQEPIVVRKNGVKNYIIEKGERRWRAAKLAKLKTLDCVLAVDLKGKDVGLQRLVRQYAENTYRDDLNPIDMAHFFRTLRDAYKIKATEIPARLKSYGIKKPYSDSYIRNLIRLTELPAWAQEHIQAGALTARHGLLLLAVKDLPDILKKIKAGIEAELKKEDNEFTVGDLATDIDHELRQNYPEADQQHVYEHTDLSDKGIGKRDPLYNPAKLPAAEREKLNIVTVPTRHGSNQYITNLGKHGQLQTQARDQILAERKKIAEKKTAAAKTGKKVNGKAAEPVKNVEPRGQGLHDYLLAWLGKAILERLAQIEDSEMIKERLIYWLAFFAPQWPEYNSFHYAGSYNWNHRKEIDDARVATAGHYSLQAFLNDKIDDIDNLMQRAVAYCDLAHRCLLAHHLGIEIERLFFVDDAYLQLYTRDGLLKLAADAKIANDAGKPPLNKKPVAELRTFLADEHEIIRCPAHVTALIKDTIDEYNDNLKESIEERNDWLKKEAKREEKKQ